MFKTSNPVAGLFLTAAAVLFAVGLAYAARERQSNRLSGGELIIDQSALRVTGSRPSEVLSLCFSMRNRSRRPVRVVGSRESCDINGCVEVQGLPVEVPPGGEQSIVISFRAGKSEVFTKDFAIYTDLPGRSTISLAVRGSARLKDE
jgi:hypothetical protein